MQELNPLRNSINSAIQRIRELQKDSEDGDFGEVESDESYVSSLKEILHGTAIPTMVLNSEKNLAAINGDCEDITGIRESAALGMSLLDVAREKGFAATLIELCDNSANNGGTSQSGEYELQGVEYTINVSSLIGKDNFAKAFYVSFVRI
jgi:transcriptional regulator with PAS, ATPase and Fis domain